jgi:short-subunit dehydrogenase
MKKVILITGISSGFGLKTAGLLAELGHIVYGTIRRNCETSKKINIIRLDLTDSISIKKAVETVIKNEGRIDVLINNAGMHTGGPIETLPAEYIKLQMDTSFYGLVQLTREVLPVMRKQGGGMIINFSSIGGLMGLPFQAFYSASKFAVEGFSEALRMEVQPFNIKIVVINPGDFHTNNSANRRHFLSSTNDSDPYHDNFKNALVQIEKDEAHGWEPVVIARKLVRIIECKKPRQKYIIASFEQKLAVILKYILPDKLFRNILENHYRIK